MRKCMRAAAFGLSLLLALSSQLTAFAYRAEESTYDPWGTSALGPSYPSGGGTYGEIDGLGEVRQEEERFCFEVKMGETVVPLHISFPSTGGFRLSSDSTGYFEPESNQKITYAEAADGAVKMSAQDGTQVNFTAEEDGFSMEVLNGEGKTLFGITDEQVGFAYSKGELAAVRLELPIADGESIYGGGEHFNELEQTGKRLLMWNVDCGYHGNSTEAELWRSYKNVPIFHSSRGYTVFGNSMYAGRADIGYTNEHKYTLEFQGTDFDFYIWTGTPEENLMDYTALTGTSILLPKWAYQYSAGGGSQVWQATGSVYGRAVEAMEGYAELGTPNIASIYVEGLSSDDANVYNVFNKTGTRVLKWNAPDMSLTDMQEAMPGVSLSELPRVKNERNPVQDSGNFIDFTADNAVELLENYLSRELSWGLAGGLIDFGELIQTRTLFRGADKTGLEMHNFFSYWYAKGYNEALTEGAKDGEFVLFARAASAGTQQYTAFFTGDQQSSVEGLRQQLAAGLSASASGLTMWGGDLAGYSGTPSETLFARGMQFSTFQPVMRSHGTSSRFPWDYGNAGVGVYQTCYWLRENLLNKIYSTAIVSHKTGQAVTKPLTMEYPEDRNLDGVYETYLFCDDFLVTPVLDEAAYTYEVTFPQGTWVSLWDGKMVEMEESASLTVEAPINQIPVYVRAGSVVPLTLNESLKLTDSMQEGESVEALLVTRPDYDRETEYWIDEETSVSYSNTALSEDTFRVTAGEGNQASAVLVKGLAAFSVTVDGQELARLDEAPTAGGPVGFYSCDNGETIINLGTADWENLDICLGIIDLPNLIAGAEVSDPDMKTLTDEDYDTSYVFSTRTGDEGIVFSLEEAKTLQNVVLKWTNDYAESYTVSVSEDGETWTTIGEETAGYGGILSYPAEGRTVKYIRVGDVENSTGMVARLYGVEAYESGQLVAAAEGQYLWVWILVGAGAVLVLAAVCVLLVISRKRKKNRNQGQKSRNPENYHAENQIPENHNTEYHNAENQNSETM